MKVINQAIKALMAFNYVPLKYHPDGRDHIQVQEVEPYQPEKFDELLKAVVLVGGLAQCLNKFESQPRQWLLDVSELLLDNKPYHTDCQLKIYKVIARNENATIVSQHADQWYWDESNWTQLLPLIEDIQQQLNDIEPDKSTRKAFLQPEQELVDSDIEKYIETSYLTSILERLEAKYKALSLLYTK